MEQTSHIEVHDPLLGISAMAMTPEVNRWMILFVAVNVIEIWVIVIRSSRRNDYKEDIETLDNEKIINPPLTTPTHTTTTTLMAFEQPISQSDNNLPEIKGPPSSLMGNFDPSTGFEWLEHPPESNNHWYRSAVDQEWNLYNE